MFKRLFAIALLGAALVACTPDPGMSPAIDPSLDVLPTDAMPTDAMPTDAMPSDMMSPEPS